MFTVGRFDTLWTIANATLGDGRRWKEIRDLNIGRHTSTGWPITHTTDHAPPGTTVELPDDANVPTTTDGQTTSSEVTVQGGDSFWTIAERALADVSFWTIAQKTLTDAGGRQPTDTETAVYWRQLIDTNGPAATSLRPRSHLPGPSLSTPTHGSRRQWRHWSKFNGAHPHQTPTPR